jgi:molecular chaperone HtpG
MTDVQTEAPSTHAFQTETKQLLKLMIHSLYSNKEIFLRELISNAADACEKLRFMTLQQNAGVTADAPPSIRIALNADARTLTVSDNGVGMSEQDVIDNLGTIARSGTRQFMDQLSGDARKDSQLIGQFGVGFYSAFIVASKVEVVTRKAGESTATRWSSEGEGSYTLAPAERDGHGTDVVLTLKDDESEFLESARIEHLVRRYSDHIAIPVALDDKVLNQAKALWTRNKSDISEDEYQSFYQHIAHDWEPPISWAHHRVEGTLDYTSLLYLPGRAPFDLWDRDQARGVQLYVKRVFIMDRAAELLPSYLRFVKGLVDTADLPLNVSREILQGNRVVDRLKSALTKRALDLIEFLAADRPEDYARFWSVFGAVLKEGVVEDAANRDRIVKLLRFATTHDSDSASVSLADYVARMPEAQTAIYLISADSRAVALNSPHLEGFKQKGVEVLLLTDPVDEWLIAHLPEFEGRKLLSVTTAEDAPKPEADAADSDAQAAAFADVLPKVQAALEGRVQSVTLSHRLTESAACLVDTDEGMSRRLEAMLRQAGQTPPTRLPVLELNPTHDLVAQLQQAADAQRFAALADVLLGQAQLAEGGRLDDPHRFVRCVNQLLSGAGSS